VDMDLGSPEGYPDFAHSPLKAPLAKRLADLALAKEYGVGDIEKAQSPMPEKAVRIGNEVKITFKTAAPLASNTKTLPGFSFGPYENRTPAEATITGDNEVTVKIPENADLSQVNYAFQIRAHLENANLKNTLGLPVPAFGMKVE